MSVLDSCPCLSVRQEITGSIQQHLRRGRKWRCAERKDSSLGRRSNVSSTIGSRERIPDFASRFTSTRHCQSSGTPRQSRLAKKTDLWLAEVLHRYDCGGSQGEIVA